jgi:hypothetical protein
MITDESDILSSVVVSHAALAQPMSKNDPLPEYLNVALNEATLLGLEVSSRQRIAAAPFGVLSLPVTGPSPVGYSVQMLFRPVGRVVVSLRDGRWDDAGAAVLPVTIEDLLPIFQSFHCQPIYGWEFFDVHDKGLARWGNRVSLDWRSGSDGVAHSITLFQEGAARHLDLCVWFDELEVREPDGKAMSLEQFVANGKRWWDAFYSGDECTNGHGLFPLK